MSIGNCVVVPAFGDLGRGGGDRARDVGVEEAELFVRLGGGELDQRQRSQEARAAADGPRSGS